MGGFRHVRRERWCPGRGLNPHSPRGERDFKSVLLPFRGTDFLYSKTLRNQHARRRFHEIEVRHAEILRTDLVMPGLAFVGLIIWVA